MSMVNLYYADGKFLPESNVSGKLFGANGADMVLAEKTRHVVQRERRMAVQQGDDYRIAFIPSSL